jgi:outer membrane lipoprotein-sorting protein
MKGKLIAVVAVAVTMTLVPGAPVAGAQTQPRPVGTPQVPPKGPVSADKPNSSLPKSDVQAATKTPANAAPQTGGLESVLSKMDEAAAAFKTVETDFVWDQYQKVVDEMDSQKGLMYFRRNGQNIEMAADITDPDKKYVLFTDGTVQVYQPKIDQVTKYNAGKNKGEFESFLVLGFGGRGHDLQKSFEVKYSGNENVGGVNAAKLDLTPKQAKVKSMFTTITLWIDPARGISVQQKFVEPSGDYRLAKYSNIKLNQKLPDNVFKLKTSGKTKVVTPNG